MITLPTDLNFILLTLVIVASSVTILQTSLDSVTNSPRWIPISVCLIAFSLLLVVFTPAHAGYISASAWVLVAIVPSLGFRLSNHFHYRGQYARARQVKKWVRLLHPLKDWPWQNAVFQAHIDMYEGRRDRALAGLQDALRTMEATPEREVLIFVLSHDWYGLAAWWESHPQQQRLEERPDVIRYYLRALGEIGRLDDLVAAFLHYRPLIEPIPIILNYAYLYLFAFGGRVELTIKFLNEQLVETLNPDMHIVWVATAHSAAQNHEMSRALLRPMLRTTKDGLTKFTVEQRLGHDLAFASTTLSPESAEQLRLIVVHWIERNKMLTLWR
jgi:hypothetical protein